VIFTIAIIVTYQLLENTLEETAYTEVRVQALRVSDLLLSEGFPTAWTNDTVLRAGLLSSNVLSMRKAQELATLDAAQLRRIIRATDNIAFTLENANGTIEAVTGRCAVGDLVVTETPANRTLNAIALARVPHPVASGVNTTIMLDDDAYMSLDDADVIVIEGNLSVDTVLTPAQVARVLDIAAERGITFIIIGNPGSTVLGLVTNSTNATNITVVGNDGAFNLAQGTTVDLPGSSPVVLAASGTPTNAEVAQYRVLATTDEGDAAIATWVYDGARVWYIATSDGVVDGGVAFDEVLQEHVERHITISWPTCGEVTVPEPSTQIVRYDRTLAHHDQLLTLRVIAWRER